MDVVPIDGEDALVSPDRNLPLDIVFLVRPQQLSLFTEVRKPTL